MKFSLLSSITLFSMAASTVFIINVLTTTDTNYVKNVVNLPKNDTQKPSSRSSITENISEEDSVNNTILELNTFRFTSVDGAILVDKNNNLIIDQNLKHWFDFYLSAIGEISLDQITRLLQQEINQLPSPGKEQAHELMNKYLTYKSELSEYDNHELLTAGESSNIEQLSDRLNWQMRLRRRHLSEEVVESFWKKDELIDNYALQKLLIKNSDISIEDKQERLQYLDNSLPQELFEFKQELYISSNLLKKEKSLSNLSDPDELRNLRIEEVGLAAAERLETIDRKQSDWQLKLLAYRDTMKKISDAEGISDTDKKIQRIQYREDNFSEKERLRLNAAVKLLSDTL